MKLSTLGYLEGMYYKPRIDRELLREYGGGLIIGSACLQGEIPRHLLAGRKDEALRAVEFYQDVAGQDRFFIELMDHGLDDEKRVLEGLADIARETGARPVATNDAHYIAREDAEAHGVLLCLQTGKTISDPSRMKFETDEFYVKSPKKWKTVQLAPEAVENTGLIADMCDFPSPRRWTSCPMPRCPVTTPARTIILRNSPGLGWRKGWEGRPHRMR